MAPAQSKPIQVDGTDKVCFLDLPPEIRNTIYDLSLVSARPFGESIASIRPGTAKIGTSYRLWQPDLQPQLLGTCKQIYEEATPVLYGNMTFEICVDPERLKVGQKGRAASERRLEAVKHIRLIRFTRYQKQSVCLKLLDEVMAMMPNLKAVRISHFLAENFRTPRTMSKALLPILKQLGSQSTDTNQQAIDGIVFELAPASVWRWRSFHRELTQAFANETKDFLRAALT